MIRHLVRLVWNRKWANSLLMLEIAVSFLVVFAIVLGGIYFADNYRRPLGFDATDVWCVDMDVKQQTDDVWSEDTVVRTRNVMNAIRDLPEVRSVAGALTVPYTFDKSVSNVETNGRFIAYEHTEVTDDFATVLHLDVTRGRWFDRDSRVGDVVINELFAHEIFGDDDPIGKDLRTTPPSPGDDEQVMRVIGVVSDYRKSGEYSSSSEVLFQRADLDSADSRPPRHFLVRVTPGTRAGFEEKLVRTLESTERSWSFEARPMSEMREFWLGLAILPLYVGGLVAVFLLAMVGLGLTGVLRQNITRRTSEIGLRRVQGATAFDICTQFLGELAVVATFGLVLGIAVVVQVPLLGWTGSIAPGVFAASVALSSALIYLLTAVCGFYPSWLATRVAPVDALRYE